MLLVGARQFDGLVHRTRAAEGDVNLKWVSEPGDKKLNLLVLGQFVVATGQSHEAVAVVLNGGSPVQELEFSEQTVRHGWFEAGVHKLDEGTPRRCAGVELKTKIPELRRSCHVQGCVPHLARIWRVLSPEESFASIKPRQRVFLAVISGELQLGSGMEPVIWLQEAGRGLRFVVWGDNRAA